MPRKKAAPLFEDIHEKAKDNRISSKMGAEDMRNQIRDDLKSAEGIVAAVAAHYGYDAPFDERTDKMIDETYDQTQDIQ